MKRHVYFGFADLGRPLSRRTLSGSVHDASGAGIPIMPRCSFTTPTRERRKSRSPIRMADSALAAVRQAITFCEWKKLASRLFSASTTCKRTQQ